MSYFIRKMDFLQQFKETHKLRGEELFALFEKRWAEEELKPIPTPGVPEPNFNFQYIRVYCPYTGETAKFATQGGADHWLRLSEGIAKSRAKASDMEYVSVKSSLFSRIKFTMVQVP